MDEHLVGEVRAEGLDERDPRVQGDGGADEGVVAGEVDGVSERDRGQVGAVRHPQVGRGGEVAEQGEDELGGGEAEVYWAALKAIRCGARPRKIPQVMTAMTWRAAAMGE